MIMDKLRTILHVDMDAFYASVEQYDNPHYRGLPVIVGSAPNERGVVSTCSYEARAYGVHSAMPSSQAARLCPDAIFLPPRMSRYQAASNQVFAIFDRFTPFVEPISVDEAFLDISGAQSLLGSPEQIARKIKAAIRDEVGITASVGIAHNKFLAKLASEENKPDGLFRVSTVFEEYLAWLAKKPLQAIWGVGSTSAQVLARYGLKTVGDIHQISLQQLQAITTPNFANHLYQIAYGIDERPLALDTEDKSYSREVTYPHDVSDHAILKDSLYQIADDVSQRLRAANRFALTMKIKIRWADFTTLTKQLTAPQPVQDNFTLRHYAVELFRAAMVVQPVRLIGFGVSHLTEPPDYENDLFADADPELAAKKKREHLCRILDQLPHTRIGGGASTTL